MAQLDQPRTLAQTHSEYKLKIQQLLQPAVAVKHAKDAALELQILRLSNIPAGKYSDELLDKAYVRVLLEDDTFVTGFGSRVAEGDSVEIVWNKPVYLKLTNPSKPLASYMLYLMVCLNSEDEISFIDQMIGNVSGGCLPWQVRDRDWGLHRLENQVRET
jgi:hypothetical protein